MSTALDLDKAREFFALRYFGALWAVHAAAPHLQPGGSIALTTGIAGRRPVPDGRSRRASAARSSR